jgi:integrase
MTVMRADHSGTKLADGRWRIRLTLTAADGTKSLKVITKPTQREVQAAAREYLAKRGRKATDPHTIAELYAECQQSRFAELSDSAKTQYAWASKRLLAYFANLKDIREIDAPMCARWLKTLAADPDLSGRGIQIHRNVLRIMLKYAVELGWIQHNPCTSDIRLPKSPKPHDQRRLSYTEARAVIDNEQDPERKLYWWTLFETAARPNEVSRLTKADVVYSQDRWHIDITRSKTDAGVRKIPLSDALGKALYDAPGEWLIFPNHPFETGGHRSLMTRRWKRALETAGVTSTNLYQLRKLRITLWKNAGVPDEAIQKLAGHTDIRITNDVYDDVSIERIHRALEGSF